MKARTYWAIILLGTSIALRPESHAGPVWDRINHLHSDENQNLAKSVKTNLTGLATSRSGVDAALLGNLDSELSLMAEVDKHRIAVHERELINSVLDRQTNWADLQQHLYAEWNLAERTDVAARNAITKRIKLVNQVGKVLKALQAGQAALAQLTAKRLTNAVNLVVSNVTTSTESPALPSWYSTVLEFRTAVTESGRAWAQAATNSIGAQDLQDRIVHEAEISRDPASIYALTAMIGAGLGEKDSNGLEQLVADLQRKLERFSSARTPNAGAGPDEAIGDQFQNALKEAGQGKSANDLSAMNLDADASSLTTLATNILDFASASAGWARNMEAAVKTFQTFASKTEKFPAATLLTGLATPSTGQGTNKAQASAGQNPILQLFQVVSGTNNAGTNALSGGKVVEKLGKIIGEIESGQAAAGQRLLQFFNDLISTEQQLYEENSRHYLALAGISSKELRRWARIRHLHDEMAKTYKFKPIEHLTNGIASELRSLGGANAAETADSVLSASLDSLQRAGNSSGTILSQFGDGGNNRLAQAVRNRPPTGTEFTNAVSKGVEKMLSNAPPYGLLFLDSVSARELFDGYPKWIDTESTVARGFDRSLWKGALIPPAILTNYPVVPTLRLLAENAQKYQNTSPASVDPASYLTGIGHKRLETAVHLLQVIVFLHHYNERESSVLGRFLLKEVKEHDIHLDSLVLRTMEADLNLRIGDTLAFHSSGWTQDDLETLLSAVQASFVGWIGSKH